MPLTPAVIRDFLKQNKRIENTDSNLVKAGVLMLFYYRSNELHVLLTKRTSDVEHHKGQISFPGGAADRSDPDIVATALRETEEEIGIPRGDIDVLGLFDDAWTPSGFNITPVVGFLQDLPKLALNKNEVEEVLEIPVAFFLDRHNETTKQFFREETRVEVYFYHYGKNEIWGATAGMLRALLVALEGYLGNQHAKKNKY